VQLDDHLTVGTTALLHQTTASLDEARLPMSKVLALLGKVERAFGEAVHLTCSRNSNDMKFLTCTTLQLALLLFSRKLTAMAEPLNQTDSEAAATFMASCTDSITKLLTWSTAASISQVCHSRACVLIKYFAFLTVYLSIFLLS
jgi:hypothetical protein